MLLQLSGHLDGGLEDHSTVRLSSWATGPLRMLGGLDVSLRMGHQAKNATGCIDQTGYIRLTSVGVDRVGPRPALSIAIGNRYVLIPHQTGKDFAVNGNQLALAMGDWHGQNRVRREEGGGSATRPKMYPTVLKTSRIVVCQGDRLTPNRLLAISWQQTRLDKDLKTVADAQNEFPLGHEFADGFLEVMDHLVGQDLACRDVVTVAETAWDR